MNILFWTFTALIMIAPLFFGMVYALNQALFACLIMGLMAGYGGQCVWQKKDLPVGLERIWPEAAGFFLVLAWAVVQITPLTPQAWHHPLWVEAGTVLGMELPGSISLARGAGFESLMRLLTYGAVFWLALQFGRDRRRASQLIWIVALAGVGYAVYGLVIHFGDLGKVLWVEKAHYGRNVTATFINRNSYATYAGMGLLCAGGLYLTDFFKTMHSHRRGRDKAMHVLQQAFVRGAPLLAGVLILLTALFLSSSRAGVSASLVAVLVMILFMGPLSRLTSQWYKVLTVSLVAAILAVFFISGDGWLHRLSATDLDRETRMLRNEQTWEAVKLVPWTGHGLGSFEQTFPIYADVRTSNTDMAHNDWLEMLYELGGPGGGLWFAVLAGLTLRCLLGFFRRRRDNIYPLIGFCACLLVALHALADFSLQIPAVAVTFTVLLGVGVAQGWSSREGGGESMDRCIEGVSPAAE